MYEFYLAGMRLPVTPSSIKMKTRNQNKTIQLINDGEANLLKLPGLMELSFEVLLPQVGYPFAVTDEYPGAADFIKKLEMLKEKKQKFRFVLVRLSPSGESLFHTNLRVSLEEYAITEDAEHGLDLMVSIELKEYRDFGTRTLPVEPKAAPAEKKREQDSAPKAKTHTVVKGDCLYNIAKAALGNGNRYPEIYKLNQVLIDQKNKGTGNPRYTIYPGQVLALPG